MYQKYMHIYFVKYSTSTYIGVGMHVHTSMRLYYVFSRRYMDLTLSLIIYLIILRFRVAVNSRKSTPFLRIPLKSGN